MSLNRPIVKRKAANIDPDDDVEMLPAPRFPRDARAGPTRLPTASLVSAPVPEPTYAPYNPRGDAIPELYNQDLPGEARRMASDEKPFRLIRDLVAYDPTRGNAMVAFTEFEKKASLRVGLVIEGLISPLPETDEDFEFTEGEDSMVCVKLKDVEKISMDLVVFNDPPQIETATAIYHIVSVHRSYLTVFERFYIPRKCTQTTLVMLLRNRITQLKSFKTDFESIYDPILDHHLRYKWLDHEMTRPFLTSSIERVERSLLPVINAFLAGKRDMPPSQQKAPIKPTRKNHSRNPDLAALDPESQTRLALTPAVRELAEPWMHFDDEPTVLGKRTPPPNEDMLRARKERRRREREILLRALQTSKRANPRITVPGREERYIQNRNYAKRIEVGGEVYQVDSEPYKATVIIIAGNDVDESRRPRAESDLPLDASLGEWFSLARVLNIDAAHLEFHVQILRPGSHTALGEIHEARELFVAGCCSVACNAVVGKAGTVTFLKPPDIQTPDEYLQAPSSFQDVKPDAKGLKFYCRFNYDGHGAAFYDLDPLLQMLDGDISDVHSGACRSCIKTREAEDRQRFSIPDRSGNTFKFRNQEFHVNDFACIYSEHSQASQIARITRILPKKSKIEVALLARSTDVVSPSEMRDQHHLIVTACTVAVPYNWVLRKVYVIHRNEPEITEMSRNMCTERYLPPDVFYVSHSALNASMTPNGLAVASTAFTPISLETVRYWRKDHTCTQARLQELRDEQAYVRDHPMHTLDLFAGVGAFSLGMREACGLDVTHAVEISPSAAKTLKMNSSDVTTYAACANDVLRDCVWNRDGKGRSDSKSVTEHRPLPIDEIDTIVAGFPCQSHSMLNMYRSAESSKTFLVLNLLSFVDTIKPKYCVFENVRGIVQWRLMAVRQDTYTATGGVPMGGLKLVLRCLTSLGYQVRYGILQAANFGVPQDRERFFFIAARSGYPLPATLAQPTHYCPSRRSLDVPLPHEQAMRSATVPRGTATFPPVTIEDAIDDLPRFNWGAPGKSFAPHEVSTNPGDDHWGLSSSSHYGHDAKTTFQTICREYGRVEDLQHFTRTFDDTKVVQRVRAVPIHPNADYRLLPRNLWEWQGAHASSANARHGFPPGLYGRLGKTDQFRTTVTNVSPTAKQSWVLHYEDKRMFTVRELARSQGFPDSFKFYAVANRVETMHRQIGNAVPWQLSEAIGRSIRKTLFRHARDHPTPPARHREHRRQRELQRDEYAQPAVPEQMQPDPDINSDDDLYA